MRGAAGLIVAALGAEGTTDIGGINYLERGYEDFDVKLRNLGAQIEKVSDEKEIRKFKMRVS